MTESEKWDYIVELDEELLRGGVILSEWSCLLVRNADIAWVSGAPLAAIISAMAGIESHLRFEADGRRRPRLVELIDASGLSDELVADLHRLRRYRNGWVHVDDPSNDQHLLDDPETHDSELEEMARFAVVTMRKVLYSNPWI